MNPAALQKQIEELARELRYSGEGVEKRLIGLRTEIDRLKIEVAALAKFPETKNPGFSEEIQAIHRETARDINPEFE